MHWNAYEEPLKSLALEVHDQLCSRLGHNNLVQLYSLNQNKDYTMFYVKLTFLPTIA